MSTHVQAGPNDPVIMEEVQVYEVHAEAELEQRSPPSAALRQLPLQRPSPRVNGHFGPSCEGGLRSMVAMCP